MGYDYISNYFNVQLDFINCLIRKIGAALAENPHQQGIFAGNQDEIFDNCTVAKNYRATRDPHANKPKNDR